MTSMRAIRAPAAVGLLVFWSCLLGACAKPLWNPGPGVYESGELGVAVEVPAGWYRSDAPGEIVLTRDGAELDRVGIARIPHGAKLVHTNRSVLATHASEELAEMRLDSLRMAPDISDFTVLDNGPARVAEHECYGFTAGWRTAPGLPVRRREYGCNTAEHLYLISFEAPTSYYYEALVGIFEDTARSIRFLPTAGKSERH